MKMPVYVCSHSSWWIIKCKLEVLLPLIRASRLYLFLVRFLFVQRFGQGHVLRQRGGRVTPSEVHVTDCSLNVVFKCVQGYNL